MHQPNTPSPRSSVRLVVAAIVLACSAAARAADAEPARPKRVVVVCDASGSLLQGREILVAEAGDLVDALDETQSFNVIVARKGEVSRVKGGYDLAAAGAK